MFNCYSGRILTGTLLVIVVHIRTKESDREDTRAAVWTRWSVNSTQQLKETKNTYNGIFYVVLRKWAREETMEHVRIMWIIYNCCEWMRAICAM
jgi:hypothetical protein